MSNFASIRKMVHDLEKETNELKKELIESKKTIEKLTKQNSDFYSSKINFNNVNDLEGKTIDNVSIFSAEYGRTYKSYIGFKCSDGTRIMIAGTGGLYNPKPKIEQMKESNFYTKEEIQKRVDEINNKNKRRDREEKEWKEKQIKRLQDELED